MELTLTARERESLEALVARPEDVRQLKRAQGLLALAEGEAVVHIARRLGVCRDTIYEWVQRFRGRGRGTAIAERLLDRPRPGRPDALFQRLLRRLSALMDVGPRAFGYRHAEWTAGLLQAHLAAEGLRASDGSIRRALQALGYRWKRPRYVPRRRHPHWRQAKGGYSAA